MMMMKMRYLFEMKSVIMREVGWVFGGGYELINFKIDIIFYFSVKCIT